MGSGGKTGSTSTSPVRDYYRTHWKPRRQARVFTAFKAAEIRVSHDALVLVLDFKLRVK